MKPIRRVGGNLWCWRAPPLKWIGHAEGIMCMSYSPNGLQIISGSIDKTIWIWDAETGAAVGNPLEGHTVGVVCVAYSPNGSHIVFCSWGNTIRIWDAQICAEAANPLDGHPAGLLSAPDSSARIHNL